MDLMGYEEMREREAKLMRFGDRASVGTAAAGEPGR
jgi:hypothetical protein